MHEVLGGVLILASVMLSHLVAVVIVGLVGGLLPALAAAVAAGAAITPSSPSTPSPPPIRTTWWPWSRSSSPAPWAGRSAWPPAGRRKRDSRDRCRRRRPRSPAASALPSCPRAAWSRPCASSRAAPRSRWSSASAPRTAPWIRSKWRAYYVVSEALTSTAKHARGSHAHVAVEQRDNQLHLSVSDDGVGGADPERGSDLVGLRDRCRPLNGSIEVNSHPGHGTAMVAELPLRVWFPRLTGAGGLRPARSGVRQAVTARAAAEATWREATREAVAPMRRVRLGQGRGARSFPARSPPSR